MMSRKPAFILARERGEFFELQDDFYEIIDNERQEQYLDDELTEEEE